MSERTTYRLAEYQPNLGHGRPVPFAVLVERGEEALARLLGESRYYPGKVDWRPLEEAFAHAESDAFEPWVFQSWLTWLHLTAKEPGKARKASLDRIEEHCPDIAATEAQIAEVKAGQPLERVLQELYGTFLATSFSERLAFLFGRYEDHPVFHMIHRAEIVDLDGHAAVFDYVLERKDLPPLSGDAPQVAAFRAISIREKYGGHGSVRDAAHAIRDLANRLPGVRVAAAVLTDEPGEPSFAQHCQDIAVIDVFAFDAPKRLQDLLHPWQAAQWNL